MPHPILDLAPLARRRELWLPQQLRQARENLVRRTGDRDPLAVFSRVMAVRHDVDRAGTHALAYIATMMIGRRQLIQNTMDRFVEPDVDKLSAPCHLTSTQCIHDAEGTI